MTPNDLIFHDLGRVPYAEAYDEQLRRATEVEASRDRETAAAGFLLLVEHPPVLTVGRLCEPSELGLSAEEWGKRGVEVARTNRGGRITYHGPGQVILYPIVDLKRLGLDLHAYIRGLEEVAIAFLATYDVEGHRDPKHTGAWVGDAKIAAIGVHIRGWITTHGMSVNVNVNLDVYDAFTPCGISDKSVASLRQLLGRGVDYKDAKMRLMLCFEKVFGVHLVHEKTGIVRQGPAGRRV